MDRVSGADPTENPINNLGYNEKINQIFKILLLWRFEASKHAMYKFVAWSTFRIQNIYFYATAHLDFLKTDLAHEV